MIIEKKGMLEMEELEVGLDIKLENVLFAKELSHNLLSLKKFCENGMIVILTKTKLFIKNPSNNAIVLEGKFERGFWWIYLKPSDTIKNSSVHITEDIESGGSKENAVMDIESGGSKEKNVEDSELGKRKLEEEGNKELLKKYKSDHLYAKEGNENSISVDDHNYSGQSKDLKQIGVPNENLKGESKFLEYLDIGAEMNIKDLESLETRDATHLKRNSGILWHKRLCHISKLYLEIASKLAPNLKNVKFPDEILKKIRLFKFF